mmetsp:Transcript_27/g.28  ORF Transcript_27/g.28 Transcript_27/m.28 type:complete len:95 (-) Transcript_27:2390-2674(-)
MVGYAPTQYVFDLDSGTVVDSNNVKFDEIAFPFQTAENISRNLSKSKPLSVSLFFSAPDVLATIELPDTAMDIDPGELDIFMTGSILMSVREGH